METAEALSLPRVIVRRRFKVVGEICRFTVVSMLPFVDTSLSNDFLLTPFSTNKFVSSGRSLGG